MATKNLETCFCFDCHIRFILCIHGYRQNDTTFRYKLGALRKLLKNYAELTFISAPHLVVQNSEDAIEQEQRGWWFSNANRTFSSKEYSDTCIGFEESLKCVEDSFAKDGPFNGLLGFSQGASFVAMLCSLQERHELKFHFEFAILISGFLSRCSSHRKYHTEVTSIPTLHVFGETDEVINKEMSEELVNLFEGAVKYVHTGGHYVPATSKEKRVYIDFLKSRTSENSNKSNSQR